MEETAGCLNVLSNLVAIWNTVYTWEVLKKHQADGQLVVKPGDYIFGDKDGVVVVPFDLIIKVLDIAEGWFASEAKSRNAMATGRDPFDVYREFDRF